MFLHTDQLINKLKFVQDGVMTKAFPEFYKWVLIEYRPDTHSLALRSFNGQSHFMALLGQPEERTVKPSKDNQNFFVFDPSKIIKSFSKIKDQVFLRVDFESKKIIFKTPNSQATNSGMPAEGFISIPSHEGKADILDVPEKFATCIRRVIWATDPKGIDPATKGIFIKSVEGEDEEYIEFCGTDRNVIAISRDEDNIGFIEGSGVVPMEAASTVASMIEVHGECEFYMDSKQLIATTGDYTLVSSLIDAPMLDYGRVIQSFQEYNMQPMRINREQMITAGDFAFQYTDRDILLSFNGSTVKIYGRHNSGYGKGEYKIGYVGVPDNVEIRIDYNRLKEAVRYLDCEEISLSFDPESPRGIIISPYGRDSIFTEIYTTLQVNDS